MNAQDRKDTIEAALMFLKAALIETETSMAIYEDNLVFFGTRDYVETGDINKIPRFSVRIQNLVR